MATVVDIAWFFLFIFGSHIDALCLIDILQQRQAGHSQFLCNNFFLRWDTSTSSFTFTFLFNFHCRVPLGLLTPLHLLTCES